MSATTNILSSDIIPEHLPNDSDSDEFDSLPSSADSSTEADEAEEVSDSDAEREWKESLQQLELLLTMVLVPYVGKYLGRRCAYWGELEEWMFAGRKREGGFWVSDRWLTLLVGS